MLCFSDLLSTAGLIIYDTETASIDGDIASFNAMKEVLLSVANGLVYQWFGGIVSIRSWTDIWINEGMANLMKYIAVNATFPEFEIMDYYYMDVYRVSLKDSSLFTHSLKLSTLNNVNNVFNNDDITYMKASFIMYTVLNIVNNYVPSHDNFYVNGVKNYLTDYQFDNADEQEFWSSFTGYGDLLSEYMPSWIDNTGYPLVYLAINTLSSDQVEITLTQQRILKINDGTMNVDGYNGSIWNQNMIDVTVNERWWIPARVQYYSGYRNTEWFNSSTYTVK